MKTVAAPRNGTIYRVRVTTILASGTGADYRESYVGGFDCTPSSSLRATPSLLAKL